jgi:hypothetical protein
MKRLRYACIICKGWFSPKLELREMGMFFWLTKDKDWPPPVLIFTLDLIGICFPTEQDWRCCWQ